MSNVDLPDVVNEHTKICRICLNTADEYYSIQDYGKLCDKIVKLSDLISECTSIEFCVDDALPVTICPNCLLQICKIHKFREMAFRSNVILRQKIQRNNLVSPHKKIKSKNEILFPIEETAEVTIANDENESIEYIEKHEVDDADNDVEYVTVILENEESTEFTDGRIEIYEDSVETEANQESYAMTEESSDAIPKISLKKHRSRRRSKNGDNHSLTCPKCGKTLSNYSSLKYHMQLHSEATPFLCSECGEGFKTRNAYDGHLVTHLEANPNKCDVCGKSYRQAASLRSHMLTHTGEKPFKCNICGKGMTQKSGYKKHLLTHTGEKPHACDICGREFRYSSNLIMHKRSHAGNKEFECLDCKKKFISKEQLKRHAAIHTGIKPYKCASCDKCFNRRSTLTIHQKIHRKFKCKFCPEQFKTKVAVTTHEKTHAETSS